jgi:hypothetical protein
VHWKGLRIDNGSFCDEDGVLAQFQIMVFPSNPREDAVSSGIHTKALHDDSLQVGTVFKIIVGQLSDVLDVGQDLLP